MSDSDPIIPSNAVITRTLKDTVFAIHNSGNADGLTVKRVRARVEQELGLPADFLKTSSDWKQKSHSIIHDTVENELNDEPPPPKVAKPSKRKPAPKKSKVAADGPRGVKRTSPTTPVKKAQKRRKTAVSSDSEEEEPALPVHAQHDEHSDEEDVTPKKPVRRGKKGVAVDSENEDDMPQSVARSGTKPQAVDADSEEDIHKAMPEKPPTASLEKPGDVSESEMSSLIDESPVKKKRQKKEHAAKKEKAPKATKSKAAKPKAASKDDDPNQAEIKRLQSWLVKCGIRKVWGKELSHCETSKEKIRHLKTLLNDAGMDGKFSNEKAARIKEQREFAADLEAIQEGEKHWGTEVTETGRPRRRLAQRPQKVVLQEKDEDDDDGEEREPEPEEEQSDDSNHQEQESDGGSGDDDSSAGDDSN
ncbi:hypothetical protein EJ04DRAFT_491804 [Polyplosphaeria fusca]|uniref:Transcriptional regulator n=1 Tax=Polyplosphaeria fusca TaxID=682080 RepID=A0A9P4QWW3_9PLEO|nr:hypothetical protein EJ04DRAFT_491804 [Polyplosphaeria fusca]